MHYNAQCEYEKLEKATQPEITLLLIWLGWGSEKTCCFCVFVVDFARIFRFFDSKNYKINFCHQSCILIQ